LRSGKIVTSAESSLSALVGSTEARAWLTAAVVRSVHEYSYGHKLARWASEPVVAGGAEAGDRGGVAGAGLVVSLVARRYDVNANQGFAWR